MAPKPRKTSKHTPKQAWNGPRPVKPAGDRPAHKVAGDRPAPAPGWESGKGGRKNPRPGADPRAGQPPKRGTFAARDQQGEAKAWDRGAHWAAKTQKKGPRPLGHSQARSQQVTRAVHGHTAPPSRGRLEELLVSHGVTLPGPVLDKVWQYHGILRRNNGDLDLTRLIGFETIVQRHYADCLILHKLMNGKWPSPLVDIGTGAGFPGLMIKIASPSTKIILSEPRNVRVDFLNNTIKELGLKDIEVFGHKFTSKSFTQPLRGAISRAFEPIAKTLPRLEKSLAVGGLAIFMKGPGVDEELSVKLPSNYKLVKDERYRIPKTTLDRALVIFERTA
jgi:16S rRNA (guanine527-N7)-methyltransferase